MKRKHSKNITVDNFPTYMLSYMLYGDEDGITDEDIDNLNKWLKKRKLEEYRIFDVLLEENCGDEMCIKKNDFCAHPAFGLACETCEVVFIF